MDLIFWLYFKLKTTLKLSRLFKDTDFDLLKCNDSNMHIRPYQKLIAWKEAHNLCLLIYKCTTKFPADERFRIVDQMCRASASIPTNIAEGSTRRTKKGRLYFYNIASTSLEELHYHCFLSHCLQYISSQEFEQLDDYLQRVSYLLVKLSKSV